ncbi:hypothetical protein ACIBI9_52080 [Nonomuraea sp. NPDC050451]|uniref:hypothetical protein n=1 Tax=Nonomuraea sp. NPDC050451 TaxID=3364364 RepID=UPI0037914D79
MTLLERIRDGRGLSFHARMSHDAGTRLGRPEFDGHPGVMRTYAEMLVEQEAKTQRGAELYFVTAEMTDLVRTAAADLPAFAPNADDFPTPAGLIVYETPLVEYRRPERTAVMVNGRWAVSPRDDGHGEIGVTACTWGPYDAGGNWRRGGVWMSFYRDRAEILARLQDDSPLDGLRADHARLGRVSKGRAPSETPCGKGSLRRGCVRSSVRLAPESLADHFG